MPEAVRWSLNITPRVAEIRDAIMEREGRSATDVATRAVQLYDKASKHIESGGEVVLRTPGQDDQVLFLL